jgi:hypothetical protein
MPELSFEVPEMNRFVDLCRRFAWLPATLTCWLWMVGAAAAAAAEEESKAPKDSNWALAYIIVLLGLTLGLMALCRPGKRSSELPD